MEVQPASLVLAFTGILQIQDLAESFRMFDHVSPFSRAIVAQNEASTLKYTPLDQIQDLFILVFSSLAVQGIEVLGQPTPRPRAAIVSFVIRYGNAPGGSDSHYSHL